MAKRPSSPSRSEASPTVLWFRRDLRLADNAALAAAVSRGGPVLPVFILEPADAGPGRAPGAAGRWWLDKSLRALASALEALGSRLILRAGEAGPVLDALVEELGAGAVVWSRTYEPAVDARDAKLAEALSRRDLAVEIGEDRLLVPPGRVCTAAGEPYAVFSPFWRKAREAAGEDAPLKAPHSLAPPARWPGSDAIDGWKLHPEGPDWSTGFGDWRPGEAGATERLKSFIAKALPTYPTDRDHPAIDGGSQMSPHLTWGEISPRQLDRAAHARLRTHGLEEPVDKFLSELAWRDFDYGLLQQQPALAKTPFKPQLAKLKWRRSKADLHAWKTGRTGYPIVDAGMRQLWRTGWMHNRLRLITSSFLVKHLLIDWREGESWFWDCLVDGDVANNPANCQWIAGVGADAQPFFRIFNPITQARRFDGDGDFVRRWAPELAKLDKRWIHEPWTAPPEVLEAAGVRLGVDYPEPIVEHTAARRRALEALQAARED